MWNMDQTRACQTDDITSVANKKDLNKRRIKSDSAKNHC